MVSQGGRRAEFLEDQGALQTATYILDFRRLFGIASPAPYRVIKKTDHFNQIVVHILASGTSPMKEIQKLELKGESQAPDDDVAGMHIAVILATIMNTLQSDRQSINLYC